AQHAEPLVARPPRFAASSGNRAPGLRWGGQWRRHRIPNPLPPSKPVPPLLFRSFGGGSTRARGAGGSALEQRQFDAAVAGAADANLFGGGLAEVDYPVAVERTAVVDPHHDRAAL